MATFEPQVHHRTLSRSVIPAPRFQILELWVPSLDMYFFNCEIDQYLSITVLRSRDRSPRRENRVPSRLRRCTKLYIKKYRTLDSYVSKIEKWRCWSDIQLD